MSSSPGFAHPSGHSFSASFAASFLLPQSLTFAVLQDSLAPLLFSVYTLALGQLTQSRGAESVRRDLPDARLQCRHPHWDTQQHVKLSHAPHQLLRSQTSGSPLTFFLSSNLAVNPVVGSTLQHRSGIWPLPTLPAAAAPLWSPSPVPWITAVASQVTTLRTCS